MSCSKLAGCVCKGGGGCCHNNNQGSLSLMSLNGFHGRKAPCFFPTSSLTCMYDTATEDTVTLSGTRV